MRQIWFSALSQLHILVNSPTNNNDLLVSINNVQSFIINQIPAIQSCSPQFLAAFCHHGGLGVSTSLGPDRSPAAPSFVGIQL